MENVAGFKKSDVATPIEYFQPITEDMQPTPPSAEELEMVKDQLPHCFPQISLDRFIIRAELMLRYPMSHVAKLIDAKQTGDDGFFIPARLHQAFNLDSEVSPGLHLLNKCSRAPTGGGGKPDLPTSPTWLDLSQIEFNPYFVFLFGRRIQFVCGFYDIELIPGQNNLTSPACVGTTFYETICAGFATHPPRTTLHIFQEDLNEHSVVFDEDEITFGQLLAALTEYSKRAIADWYDDIRFEEERRRRRGASPSASTNGYLQFSPSPSVKLRLEYAPSGPHRRPNIHFTYGDRWLLENDK